MTATASSRPVRRPAAPAGAARRWTWSRLDLHGSPYLFIAPFFVLFGLFGLFPLLYTAWVSLRSWDLTGDAGFVGGENYSRLMSDPDFWNALLNTVGLFLLSTIPQLLCALVIAGLLNRPIRALLLFRLGVLAPIVTSVAAVAIVFGQLYGRDAGLVNGVLGLVDIGPIDWQASKGSSWIAVASMVNWRWTGYNALIYLAAIQAIPRDLYEAAQIDGAGAIRQFRSITVPLIRPALIFTVVMATIGVFLMRQYAERAVPDELIEAARLDGCSTFGLFLRVVAPALRPGAAVLGLFTFMSTWNEFLWPLAILEADNPTVQFSLSQLATQYYTDYTLMFTGTLVATVPLLVVFVLFGRQLISGIMDGAVRS